MRTFCKHDGYILVRSHCHLIEHHFYSINHRTSATNCACIFNTSFVNQDIGDCIPPVWNYRLEMTVDDVWNGFFIHSLLLDHEDHGSILKLDHHAPSQMKQLQPALQV